MFQGNISGGASQLNTSQAARALHHAVARLRAGPAGTVSKKGEKTKASFLRWVPLGSVCSFGKIMCDGVLPPHRP